MDFNNFRSLKFYPEGFPSIVDFSSAFGDSHCMRSPAIDAALRIRRRIKIISQHLKIPTSEQIGISTAETTMFR